MTDETDPISDGIARALGAASAANDAAQELDQLQAQHRAFVEGVMRGQKRMTAIALGTLAGAGVAVLLGGLVYFRSLADLREASALQVTAGEVMVERIAELKVALDRADEVQTALEAQSATLQTALSGLGDRISGDIRAFAAEAAAVEPQFASAMQAHMDESLATTRDALLAALGDLDLSIARTLEASAAGGSDAGELKALLDEMRKQRATPVRAAAAEAPARPASRPARPARPRAPAPKAADNPIKFP